jgi:alpha-1,3-rhamnosyl/mannosyltransferase
MTQPGPVAINTTSLLGPLTGIGQYTLHLAREMRTLLPEPPWLYYGGRWSRELLPPHPAAVAEGKRLVGKAIPFAFHAARWLQQKRFSAGVRAHRIALYHEPNYLAFRFAGPTVVTVHDLSWVRYPSMHPAERVASMESIMPRVVREAAAILTDSEFVRGEVIAHFGVAADRVTAVPLGVSPEYRPRTPDETRDALASLGLEHGRYALAVGTLEPRKNVAGCIAAYATLPAALRERFPLVVAGAKGWGDARLPDAARELVRTKQLRFAGFVDAALLPALYAGARVFVYPSVYEGFGLPPLEAMACGVPVIVSRRASLPEVVGDAGALVEPDDEAAIARLLRELLEDDARARALATAGLARAARFSWRECALRTLEVYTRVAR